MQTLIENQDYKYIDFKNSDITGIQLLIPEFLEVIYHYGKVRVVDEEDGKIEFSYTIVHPGKSEYTVDELNENRDFHLLMSDILSSILWTRLQEEMNQQNLIEYK